MSKFLIIAGIFLIIIGIMLHFKISIPFLGRLPGDIMVKGDHYQVYFPLTSSLLFSIILSIIFYFLSRKS
ncbi:hypothetical protein PHSC3_001962 [Chlamydiales bacterium STE3]|nr:hypothetical protein PHSC3_001962 [Chlamydiales bacterium STE3]